MKLISSRVPIVLGAALALGIGGGIAVAQIPSASGEIRACYDNGGNLKVIDEDKNCAKGWTALTWYQQGQPGADGVSGYEIVTNDKSPGVGFLGEAASCPAGKKVVGGGASAVDENGHEVTLNVFNLLSGYPINDGTAWAASWLLTSNSFANDVRVHAICVTVN